ncbi:hypothetical protein MPOCJGCO_4196 [Methylobacterium trifolii]|uniref:Uncharacterized protein n=1 Tax=Methylobacterium trifolii TaxID=1003092 RepID=A0ABQ4U5F1_9HYPH|nr:hypothetical protein MPOCJGCO_4196 [Methylobacterium trifolii]
MFLKHRIVNFLGAELRIAKPRQFANANPAVLRELRKIAEAGDVKSQDLYGEGLREVFKRRGLNFDNMDRREET